MDNSIIFHKTDDDGDSLDVKDLRIAPYAGARPRNALMVHAETSFGEDSVLVRLTRGSVEKLRDALNEWLSGDGSVVCPPEATVEPLEQTLKNLPEALREMGAAAERFSQALSGALADVSKVEPAGAKESEQCCEHDPSQHSHLGCFVKVRGHVYCPCKGFRGTRKDIAGGPDHD